MRDLIADRFAAPTEGRVVDLATGLDIDLERVNIGPGIDALGAPGWRDGRELLDAGCLNASGAFLAWSRRPTPRADTVTHGDVRNRLVGALEIVDTAGETPGGCAITSRSPERLDHAWLVIARQARLRGIVPVGAHVIHAWPAVVPLLAGRLVAFLAPATGDGPAVGALVQMLAGSDRRACRVGLLFSFGAAGSGKATIDLDDGASRPTASMGLSLAQGVAEAWPTPTLFPDGEPASKDPASTGACAGWTDPFVARCELRLRRAERAIARGRHRPAMHDLKSVIGIARIDDHAPALQARAAVSLAEAWLMAGRVRAAERSAREALATAAPRWPWLAVRAACALAHARIEQQRFTDADRILAPLVEVAGPPDAASAGALRLALARCRFWQGQHEGLDRLLDVPAGEASPGLLRSALRLRARVCLARGDVSEAGTLMASRWLHRPASDARDQVSTSLVAACVQAAVGEMDAVRGHVTDALRGCRQAGLSSRAIAVHTLWAEAAARWGAVEDVRRASRFLLRVRANTESALLRSRIDRALEAAGRPRGRSAGPAVGSRFDGGRGRGRVVVDELLEVLTICHEADDDGPALERVCAALRTRLGASCVCVVGDRPDSRLALAGHHRAVSSEVAQRAIATGAIVPTVLVRDGWETAAPVRYGGTTIGALACRWTVDSSPDRARVEPVLATAAAACAPSVRAALDRAAAHSVAEAADLGLIGTSRAMDGVRAAIVRAAAVPFHVLIEGESGSGKEVVAKAIHRVGPRRGRRFCAVNCAALPDDLLEAELFGHARGAFTGAVAERAGLFEDADGGTLFLDEVGELSPRAQAKLLRAIQENEVRRLGEALPRRVDARVVAASNRSLAGEAEAGRFRVDLRYRLEVVRIVVPPLRERREDVALLAGRFWEEFARHAGTRALLDRAVIDALTRYDWPGNVRELQNVVASLAVHAPRRGRVGLAQLPGALSAAATPRGSTLDEARRAFEASYVRQALCRAGGRRSAAARELGVTRQGLSKLITRLGVCTPDADTGRGTGAEGQKGTGAQPRGAGGVGAW